MKTIIVRNIGNTSVYLFKYLLKLKIPSPFKLIKKRIVYINNCKAKTSSKVQENDIIKIYANIEVKENTNLNDIYKIPIIHEDENLIIINKPAGIASQGGSKVEISVDQIFKQYKLVHRLDKDTNGLMILAKTLEYAQKLTLAFKEHEIQKYYEVEAYFRHYPKAPHISNTPDKLNIRAKEDMIKTENGISKYKIISDRNNIYKMIFQPVTGKKHQIRKHIVEMGGHIIGDSKYTPKNSPHSIKQNLQLRCYKLSFFNQTFTLDKNNI